MKGTTEDSQYQDTGHGRGICIEFLEIVAWNMIMWPAMEHPLDG
jgi:hypothetical protein